MSGEQRNLSAVRAGVRGHRTLAASARLRQPRGVSTFLHHGLPVHLTVPDSFVTGVEVGVTKVVIPDPAVGGDSLTLGDGTGSPTLELDKAGTGSARVDLSSGAGDDKQLVGRLSIESDESLVLAIYDASEVLVGSLTFSPSTGAITSLKGITISAGGLTVTAGGATISAGNLAVSAGTVTAQAGLRATTGGIVATAGGLTVTAGGASIVAGNVVLTAGVRMVGNLPSALDDTAAAALSPTVPVGGLYHTAGAVKQRLA